MKFLFFNHNSYNTFENPTARLSGRDGSALHGHQRARLPALKVFFLRTRPEASTRPQAERLRILADPQLPAAGEGPLPKTIWGPPGSRRQQRGRG